GPAGAADVAGQRAVRGAGPGDRVLRTAAPGAAGELPVLLQPLGTRRSAGTRRRLPPRVAAPRPRAAQLPLRRTGLAGGRRVHPVALAGAGLLAFIVVYLAVVLAGFGDRGRPRPAPRATAGLVVVAALGIGLVAGYTRQSHDWLILMLYVGAAGGSVLRRRIA